MPTAPPTPLDQREAELFAGREAEFALFEERFDPPPARDERRVLLFTGVGGLGKSALARAIVRKLQAGHAERPAAWAHIDFADAGATDPVQACLQIRLQLGAALGGARFPIFDVAFARYHRERYPGSDVRRQFAALDPGGAVVRNLARVVPEPARDGSLWQDAADGISELVESLPLAGLAYRHLNEWVQRGEDWWDRRARPLLQQLDQLGADQIAAHLPRCLGADLADAIGGMAHRLPVAVIGDTAEAFNRGQGFQSGIGAFHNDAWLRELVWHSRGVLFVLLGRDPLAWHEHEHSRLRDWRRIVETRPVSPLGDAEARRIVERFPVPEPAIRERMVAGAAGLPFYLGLQLDLYREYLNAGQPPCVDAFGVAPDAIVTRFLSHLDQRVERSLVTLAHARRFDEELYRWLRKAHPELVADTSFPELTRFSFVEVDEGGSWRLHQLMRDVLQSRAARDDPGEQQAIHEALFAYWDVLCRPVDVRAVDHGHELALEEAAHHAAALDGERYFSWVDRRLELFHKAGRYGVALRLWERASIVAEAIYGPREPELARVLGNLGVLRNEIGDLAGALEAHERSLMIREQAYGSDHPDVGRALGNIGVVRESLGSLAGARAAHERALGVFEHAYGPDHPDVAGALTNLGNARAGMGDLTGAREALERALAIMERACGPGHPDLAATLTNLGLVREDLGDLAGALGAHQRALGVFERAYGPDHPYVAGTLSNLGKVREGLDDPVEARAAYERAHATTERAYGPDHPATAHVLLNLAACLAQLGEAARARPLGRRGLATLVSKLGPSHPDTQKARAIIQEIEGDT